MAPTLASDGRPAGQGQANRRRSAVAAIAATTTTTNGARRHTATAPTATPTSGSHNPSSARCGIFGQEVPAEFAVHSLEHGTVVIWYQQEAPDETIAGLRDIVNRYDDRVILSPNSRLGVPVAATAWNRLKAYDGADPEIAAFVETYRNRGPESLTCAY
jgi:hypothetical protein